MTFCLKSIIKILHLVSYIRLNFNLVHEKRYFVVWSYVYCFKKVLVGNSKFSNNESYTCVF